MSGPADLATPGALQRLMRAEHPPSDEQFRAITAPLEPAVVVAGAGSGKTTVMAARVVYLVATGQVGPEQVLGLTFTTKAAGELATRVRAALRSADLLDRGEEETEEPTVATYNAYAASLLTEHGLRIGHEPDTRVVADASRYQLAARAIARYTGEVTLLSDHPETVIGWVLGLEGAMSEHLVGLEQLRAFQRAERAAFAAELDRASARADLLRALDAIDRREELLGLVAAYRHLKRDLGLMDFSDQIALGARLASEQPAVGAAEREKFRVVLLDEYQDTSVAQATMLGHLFSGPEAGVGAGQGRGHPVTAVGDPNQAIYGWRGASVSNILGFGRDFPAASGDEATPSYPLSVNHRSDRRILEVANRLAEPLHRRFPQVLPLAAARPDEGTVRAAAHETYAEELAWLPDQVVAAHDRTPATAWSDIGVLVRDNAHAADVFDALSAARVPVEIVGLQGLLRLPEVAEVVAALTLLHDLTANAALLTLLSGPRWSVGPRDLALLGRRAVHLSGPGGRAARDLDRDVGEELAAAVSGSDPTEVASLCDALDDPGEADYSPQARERFALLAAELRRLRSHAGEPLLDLVRRIIDTTGIDVELAASVSPAAPARRDNLDLFVKAVAEFQAVDGAVTLPALLAYLQTEDELGNGLDVATPTEADSVKLLTVHRAKGLEWDSVFLVGVVASKFPHSRGRSRWTTSPGVLPTPLRGDARDLPRMTDHSPAGLKRAAAEWKEHEELEERRLGYVAFTRARHQLVVSSYLWGPTQVKPLGPSAYQEVVRGALESWGARAESWCSTPEDGAVNPQLAHVPTAPWPPAEQTAEVRLRLAAATEVRAAVDRLQTVAADEGEEDEEGLDVLEAVQVAGWDDELERLLEEARRDRSDRVAVPLPSSLSATSLASLRADPAGFAAAIARPMPRKPSPAARFGTRFHAWVEARFGQQLLLDPDELPGRADPGIDDDSDLQQLVAAFEAGPFADRPPLEIEPPFALVLGGQVVRGRIDAVYAETTAGGEDGFLVVDWKTNRRETADPLQLALYRVAWAELRGVPVERVRAAFYYVRSGRLVEPETLEDRAALERIVTAGPPAASS